MPKPFVLARVPLVLCPGCHVEMTWPIDFRTGIQDKSKVQCTQMSCEQYQKVYYAPTVELNPVPTK